MERAGRLIGKIKIPSGAVSPEDLVRTAWPVAVGRKIASYSAAISLVRKTLIVEVEDATWQRQLTTMRSQIVARLREVVGSDIVEEVAFRPMVPRRQPQRAETVRPQPGVPADDADSINDAVLRSVYKNSRKRASA